MVAMEMKPTEKQLFWGKNVFFIHSSRSALSRVAVAEGESEGRVAAAQPVTLEAEAGNAFESYNALRGFI